MSLPYTDIEVTDKYIIREFSENIDPIELLWHRDDEDRTVEILEDTDWKLQLEDQLPISTATQAALDTKVDENAPIVAATKAKITYDDIESLGAIVEFMQPFEVRKVSLGLLRFGHVDIETDADYDKEYC